MQKYRNGTEFHSALTDEDTTALFYMATCPFCSRFCPQFESRFGKSPNHAMVALGSDSDPAWGLYAINVVPTVIIFRGKRIVKRYDGLPGIGLDIGAIE